MSRPARVIVAAVMAVGLSACSSAPARTFGKPETDSIHQLIAEFVDVYNAKDATKTALLFTDGGVVMPPNASAVRGTENVRIHYQKRFDQGASDLSVEANTIAGSGSLAFASGDYRLNMAPPGGVAQRDRGKFIFILRELNGRWRLDHLMFSSDFAPGGPDSR
ncbi:MAG TPA: nuclear transport factor 2 family protein [Vicinamibacterales bacterium]|nr:nuclear transport factor 2 family protein [Vicinamibacterales bacterium]